MLRVRDAIAAEAGAKYAIAYVNRASRLQGDGLKLVQEMAQILRGSQTEILAASLKSPQEAAAALLAGANHLTLPLSLLNYFLPTPVETAANS